MGLHILVGIIALLAGCAGGGDSASPRETELDTATVDSGGYGQPGDGMMSRPTETRALAPGALVDSTIVLAAAGEEGWNYHLDVDVDLDGDGRPERAVVAARVDMHQGRPAWDDRQPWAVYVESADGERTTLYAQHLQIGTLRMRVTLGEETGRPTIVMIEHLPDRIRIFEAAYAGPGEVEIVLRLERSLDPRGDLASPQLPLATRAHSPERNQTGGPQFEPAIPDLS